MTADEIRAKLTQQATTTNETESAKADEAMAVAASQAANPGNEVKIQEGEQPKSPEAAAIMAGTSAEVSVLQDQLARALQTIAELSALVPKPTLPQVKVLKRYHSVTPFMNFPYMVRPGHCQQVTFVAGILETDDPLVQVALDAAVDAGTCGVSFDKIVEADEYEKQRRADMADVAGRAHARMVGAGLPTA